MTLTLELLPETQRRLETLATKNGQEVTGFVNRLIDEKIYAALEAVPFAGMTFEEVAAPIRDDFTASGMTEAEFDALIEQARAEVWQEQRAAGQSQ